MNNVYHMNYYNTCQVMHVCDPLWVTIGMVFLGMILIMDALLMVILHFMVVKMIGKGL